MASLLHRDGAEVKETKIRSEESPEPTELDPCIIIIINVLSSITRDRKPVQPSRGSLFSDWARQ